MDLKNIIAAIALSAAVIVLYGLFFAPSQKQITEETIELTDPKAVAEALGLNEKKKKQQEPVEIEEEGDLETLETGK